MRSTPISHFSRRQFLKGTVLAAALGGFSPNIWAQDGKKMRISVQLYSVREDCKKDFDAALAEVAKILNYVVFEL